MLGVGLTQFALKFLGELARLRERFEDGRAPLFELALVDELLLQVAQLRVVQTARGFLTVAGDEGHGGALIEQRHGGAHLFGAGADGLGNARLNGAGHVNRQFGHVSVRKQKRQRADSSWACASAGSMKGGVSRQGTGSRSRCSRMSLSFCSQA